LGCLLSRVQERNLQQAVATRVQKRTKIGRKKRNKIGRREASFTGVQEKSKQLQGSGVQEKSKQLQGSSFFGVQLPFLAYMPLLCRAPAFYLPRASYFLPRARHFLSCARATFSHPPFSLCRAPAFSLPRASYFLPRARDLFPPAIFPRTRLARLRGRLGSWARGIATESPLGAA
jgi:hypothetical protein